MYYNNSYNNDPIDDLNKSKELIKDENSAENYEFNENEDYVDLNLENTFRFNDAEVEDDFAEFIPFYCPYFRQQHFPGGNNPPPRPPYGPPGGHPGMPPGGPGGQQGMPPYGHQGMPSTPPPSYKPPKPQEHYMHGGVSPHAVDPYALRPCRYRFTYIWLTNGDSYWAYITNIGRHSVSGYRWNGRRWVYFGIDLRRIESFTCR